MFKALTMLLVLPSLIFAQDAPLEIKGNVRTVKVPRVVTVYDDVTVVGSLPFSVNAPDGAMLYAWTYPVGLKVSKRGRTLTILEAPPGTVTVSVEMVKVDFDARKVATTYGEVTFAIGDSPTPDPKPLSPLAADLKQFLDADLKAGASKASIAQLSAHYDVGVRAAADQSVTTIGQFFTVMAKAEDWSLAKNELKQTRERLASLLNQKLPKDPAVKMDDAVRGRVRSVLTEIRDALNELR